MQVQVSTGEGQTKDRVDLKSTALFVRNCEAFFKETRRSTVEQIKAIGAIGNSGFASDLLFLRKIFVLPAAARIRATQTSLNLLLVPEGSRVYRGYSPWKRLTHTYAGDVLS